MSVSTWVALQLGLEGWTSSRAHSGTELLLSAWLASAGLARWLLQCTAGLVAWLLISAAWAQLGYGECWLAVELGQVAATLALWVGMPLVLVICLLLLLIDSVARAGRHPSLEARAGIASHQVTVSALLVTLGMAVLAPRLPLGKPWVASPAVAARGWRALHGRGLQAALSPASQHTALQSPRQPLSPRHLSATEQGLLARGVGP